MENINEDIKNNRYRKTYLIYGEEDYLKRQYKEKLKQAIIGDDTMNYSYFDKDNMDISKIIDIGNTLPFFSEKRLIIIENSGMLKSSNDEFNNFIKNMPEYLIIIFVEDEIDKRNKVYKTLSEIGYVAQMQEQTEETLSIWIKRLFENNEKTIEPNAIRILLDKTGASMELIKNEVDKLISYSGTNKVISVNDVESVCATQTTSRIFDMLAAIANKNQRVALDMYYDLLSLKEPPMRILYLIVRQFNGILQTKEELKKNKTNAEIAKKMKVAPFVVGKYVAQAKNFDIPMLHEILNECAQLEYSVKTGKIDDKLAVELIIIKYSSRK